MYCVKASYRPVYTGPVADWYVDRSLPGGTAKIDRRRSISFIGGRFRLLAVDFDRRRSIEGEIDHRRSIEEEKGKKKKRKRSTSRCPRLRAARGRLLSQHWERDRGDITPLFLF
ncbi:hypothetical protein B296_00049680 [Ensete ventricosum]|uniref:Uncharacterized protein n=1 Tax=Ensete ventricosum TaxID=4639 RepID=A0A426YCU3_ENSVE|nr:hypothetical protein B296_00049680 [Ensete ventricosum]